MEEPSHDAQHPTLLPLPSRRTSLVQTIFAIIVLLMLAGIVGTLGFYLGGGQVFFSNLQTQNSATTTPAEINSAYVQLLSVSPNKATFLFRTALIEEVGIANATIKQCFVSTSAAAEFDGRQPECMEVTQKNKFSLNYNDGILTISGPNQGSGEGWGPFELTCASCAGYIEFSGIHAPDGTLLPPQKIQTEFYGYSKNGESVSSKGLKIYKNEEYGFEFQYPSNLDVEIRSHAGTQDAVLFLGVYDPTYVASPGADGMTIRDSFTDISFRMYAYSDALFQKESNFIKGEIDHQEKNPELGKHTETLLNEQFGIVGYDLWSGLVGPVFESLFHDDKHLFVVSTAGGFKDIAKGILKTFKFTSNSVSSTAWKTYRNEKYGFEFQYPSYVDIGSQPVSEYDGSAKLNLRYVDHKNGTGAIIRLWPLETFKTTDDYSYQRFFDIQTKSFVEQKLLGSRSALGSKTTLSPYVQGENWNGYNESSGDGGSSLFHLFVPLYKTNVVIDILTESSGGGPSADLKGAASYLKVL